MDTPLRDFHRYKSDPYGKAYVLDASGNPKADPSYSEYGNPWTFTGRRLDGETGVMYFRNRPYDVALGRFGARDRKGLRRIKRPLTRYKVLAQLYDMAARSFPRWTVQARFRTIHSLYGHLLNEKMIVFTAVCMGSPTGSLDRQPAA